MIKLVLKSVVPLRKFNALGAMGLISTVVNAGMQDYQNRKNREYSEYMLDRQQQFQREMNANSTLIQKQGLQRAGLPVTLMAGPGDYNASSVLGDSTSQVAPSLDGNLFLQAAKQKQDQPLIDAQVAKTDAETREIEERIRNLQEDTTGKGLANYKAAFENKNLQEAWDLALREGLSRIGLNSSSQDLNEATTHGKNVETSWQEDTYDERKRELTQNIEYIISRKDLTDKQKLTEIAKEQEAYASAAEKKAAAKLHNAQAKETIELLDPKKNKLVAESGLSEANQLLVLYKASIAENDADWRSIENFLKNAGLGATSVKAIVSGLRKAHSAMKN